MIVKYRILPLLVCLVVPVGCGPHTPPPQKLLGPSKLPPTPPPVKSMSIDAALQAQAKAQVLAALGASDPILRAHGLEIVKITKLPEAQDLLSKGLGDSSSLVRKAAALATGELQLKPLHDSVLNNLSGADLPERMADIFALHRLGDTRYSHLYEQTAMSLDPHVRGDTALMLGLLGEKSAIPILLQMRKDSSPAVRLQAGAALWALGEERGEDDLVAATLSAYPDDQMIALLALAQPRDTRILANVEGQLTNDYPEVALVAARATGQLGSDDGYGVALKGVKSVDPRQRFLAAMALGDIGRTDAQPVLQKLLTDGDADTRLAAAGALLQLGNK